MIRSNHFIPIVLLTIISSLCFSCQGPKLKLLAKGPGVMVFNSNEEGYKCFRIPAIIQAQSGDLLAFCEGRKKGCSDTGDIDLVMKRSKDKGKTWSSLQVIWDDSTNTCGNPAPVIDRETGVIFLLSTWNLGTDHESQIIDQTSEDTRHVYVLSSQNQGESWTEARKITEQTKLSEWTWYATGPGSGIQLRNPSYSGRLMVGCDHIEAGSKKYYSHVIYSDDHGDSWNLGGTTPHDQVNECEVAELPDGKIMINMRNYDRNKRFRQTAISSDGGMSWLSQRHDTTLIEPICQASLQSYSYQNIQALLFSNPADKSSRINMSVRISFDHGQSWPDSVVIHSGPSAYSDLIVLDQGEIGCFFESGVKSPYERIVYSSIILE